MSRHKRGSPRYQNGSRKVQQNPNDGTGSVQPHLLTISEASEMLRASRNGITALFSLTANGTLESEVLLYDARQPAMSRTVHILEMRKYLKPPLDAQLAKMEARWQAEQAGLGGGK